HEAGRRLDEPVVIERKIVARRGGNRSAVSADGRRIQVQGRIVDGHVVVFLADHDVGKEAAIGGYEVGAHERHLNADFRHTVEIVPSGRAEEAGRGSQMHVPAAHIQLGNIGADLETRENLVQVVVALGVDHSASGGAGAGSVVGRDALGRDFAADA